MIHLSFSIAICLFITITTGLIFLIWIFYTHTNYDNITYQTNELSQCPYCTYTFLNYQKGQIQLCPRCHCLIDKNILNKEKDT